MQQALIPKGNMISIIIPIHNAFNHVYACIESVLQTTTNDNCTIVLIDDASTEPEIGEYLSSIAQAYPHRIHLITLEKNVGFVQAVNYGFSQTRGHDIALLNSDTIVYDGWLERLSSVAIAHPDTGSVTPVSNEASIYSVAKDETQYLKEKGLIKKFAYYVSLLEQTNVLQIPTAVGFCMYIPWRARAIVGVFNEAFGRGYGEENDWCMRATNAGFTHYLDDRTFVFHEGGVSMSLSGDIPSRKERSIPSNEELLQTIHPHYRDIVESFMHKDTRLPAIRERIDVIANNLLMQSQCTIAHILHNSPRSTKVGGTEKHVEDLVLSMGDVKHYVLFPSGNGQLTVAQFDNATLEDIDHISIGTYTTKAPAESLQEFKEFLIKNHVAVVHIHQLIGSNFSLIEAAKECGITVIYSIHDYYAIGSPQLLDSNKGYSGIPSGDVVCPSDSTKTYKEWQQDVYPILQLVDTYVAPSHTARDTFAQVFPFIKERCLIQGHGTRKIPPHAQVENYHHDRICFLGYVHADHKGKVLIESVLPHLIDADIDVYFLGTSQSEWPELEHNSAIHFLDRYTEEELPALLHCVAPKIVCLFSNWPETYSYTLSECWRMRIPVCTTDNGALAERIKHYGGGIILKSEEPKDIVHTLIDSIDTSTHDALCNQIDTMALPTIKNVSDWYHNLYENFPRPKQINPIKNLPNFLIIGGQKCGSTWLWKNLSEHPNIYLPTQSECEFFSKNNVLSAHDIDTYRETFFSNQKDESLIGEKTASYFWTSTAHQECYSGPKKPNPTTPKHVYDILGKDTKIILSLRHPVMRALSAYCHHLHHGSLIHTGNFLETAKQHGIIHMGFYASHLREWLAWFPKENIHTVILEEDIIKNPSKTLHNIHAFLGTPQPEVVPDVLTTVLKGIKRTHVNGIVYAHMNDSSSTAKHIIPITTETDLEELYALYLPEILELEHMLQKPLQQMWNKNAFCKSSYEKMRTAIHTLQEDTITPLLQEQPIEKPAERTPSIPLLEKAAYYTFSCLKDLWTDFGEPFPNTTTFIRHRVLGKIWPAHSSGNRSSIPDYSPIHFFSHEEKQSSHHLINNMAFLPSLHLLLPVCYFDEIQLRQCLNALSQQTYTEWKVTIIDASDSPTALQKVVHEYATHFPHKFLYSPETRTSIIQRSTEMFIGFLRIQDCLLPHALETMMSAAFQEAELPDAIYSDHDECLHRGAPRYTPIYKPDWSPELLLSYNYVRPFFIIKRDTLLPLLLDNSFHSDAYSHDILLHLADGSPHVTHIPEILYHYYGDPLRDPYFENESKKAVEKCLQRRSISGDVIRPEASIKNNTLFFQIFYKLAKEHCPKVTIIIPTKDRIDLLQHCINTIRAKTDYPNYEIVIIDNNSTEPETQQYLNSIPEQVILINTPEFNFAHINNEVVARTSGELILLLNNDTEPADPHWLTALVGTMLLDTRIGVVGSRLLYPLHNDAHRVQSIGMVIGRNWASLVQVDTKDALGYENYNYALRNCSAIGGACLLTRRKLFCDIGGLDEQKFGVDFGDVDYCLRVQQEGYRVVCNPLSSVIHHESATRGNNGGIGAHLNRKELSAFENKWGHLFGHDPYYNPHFSLSIHHKAFSTTVRR